MIERGYGLRCPACDHEYSTTEETRGRPEQRPTGVIVRERSCNHCGHVFESLEYIPSAGLRARMPDPRRLLHEQRRERYLADRSAVG